MLQLGKLAFRRMDGRVTIAAVLALGNATFLKINHFLRMAERIRGSLINRHGQGITQTLLPLAPMHRACTTPLQWFFLRHNDVLRTRPHYGRYHATMDLVWCVCVYAVREERGITVRIAPAF